MQIRQVLPSVPKNSSTAILKRCCLSYTDTDVDGHLRKTEIDTHTVMAYGEYKPSNWYVNGIASYGWSDYTEKKFGGINAKYDVDTYGLQAMTGYDMNVNGYDVTPEAGLRYVHISQDAYTDDAGQRVSANDLDILTAVAGAKVAKDFELSNGMNIRPEARLAMTYDLANDKSNSVVSLANGSAYTVEGDALDRFGIEAGLGVTADIRDNLSVSAGYEGKFRDHYEDHTGLLSAKYKF
jgi:outer membrane autotransporter protein